MSPPLSVSVPYLFVASHLKAIGSKFSKEENLGAYVLS